MTTTEDWSEAVTAAAEPPTVEVKLFGKWNPDEIHVNDISLAVSLPTKAPIGRLCNVYILVFVGLHICEGEGSKVLAAHRWSLCRQTVQKGSGIYTCKTSRPLAK